MSLTVVPLFSLSTHPWAPRVGAPLEHVAVQLVNDTACVGGARLLGHRYGWRDDEQPDEKKSTEHTPLLVRSFHRHVRCLVLTVHHWRLTVTLLRCVKLSSIPSSEYSRPDSALLEAAVGMSGELTESLVDLNPA